MVRTQPRNSLGKYLLWDMNIQCDHTIEARRPDIVIIDKVEKSTINIDVAIPRDKRIDGREKEKIEKYQDIKQEIQRLWSLQKSVCGTCYCRSPWKCDTQFQEI